MLIKFNFENFKSFRDKTTLDMSATRIKSHSEHIVNMGKEKLLCVSAIFGPNAIGKSNLLEAFRCMSINVIKPTIFMYGEVDDENNEVGVGIVPFLFDNESKDKPTIFEVFFMINDDPKMRTYQYGFSVDKNGIVKEWLNYRAKTSSEYKIIFYRDREKEELILDGINKKYRENIEVSMKEKILLVSLGKILNIEILSDVYNWFLNNEFLNFGNPLENLFLSKNVPQNLSNDENIRKNVVNYISSFDSGIIDLKIERKDKRSLKIFSVHKNPKTGEIYHINMKDESSGTQKMFALYKQFYNVLRKGGIFVIDELDSRLHPQLVRSLISTFLDVNINKNNAQLIFTTHDIWQLSNELFRQDEILFVEKDNFGISKVYSLEEYRTDDGKSIRYDENYAKNYMTGKYGAFPNILKIYI